MFAKPISISCVVVPFDVCVESWKKKSPPSVIELSIVSCVP